MSDIISAEQYLLDRKYALAEKAYRQLISNNQDVSALFGLGLALQYQCKYDEAFHVFEGLHQVCTEQEVCDWLIETAYWSGRFAYASDLAMRWIDEGCTSPTVIAMAIKCCRLTGRWGDGVRLIDIALEVECNEKAMLEGWIFYCDHPDGNEGVIDNLAALSGVGVEYRLGYVYALIRFNRPVEALSVLNELQRGDVEYMAPLVDIYRAWLESIEGNFSLSEQILASCQAYAGKLPEFMLVNGRSLIGQKNYYRAAQVFSTLLNQFEGFWRESKMMAEVSIRYLHCYKTAYIAYAKLFVVNAGRADDLHKMAWVALHNDQFSEALNAIAVIRKNKWLGEAELLAMEILVAVVRGDLKKASLAVVDDYRVFGWYVLAIFSLVEKKPIDALNHIEKALLELPGDITLLKAKLSILSALLRWDDVSTLARKCLEVSPLDFELTTILMEALAEIGDLSLLSKCNDDAAKIDPARYRVWMVGKIENEDDVDKRNDLAQLFAAGALSAREGCLDSSLLGDAEYFIRNAIESSPDVSRLKESLFLVLEAEEKFDECFSLLSDISVSLDRWQFLIIKAGLYLACGNNELALQFADEAYETGRLTENQCDHLANIYGMLGVRVDRSEKLYHSVMDACPEVFRFKWNYCCFLRGIGRFTEAEKLVDAERVAGRAPLARRFNVPMWSGEVLEGKSLLVWRGQGVGDELHRAKYFSALLQDERLAGASIKIECDSRLVEMFSRVFRGVLFVPELTNNDLLREDIDYHLPADSLAARYPAEFNPALVRLNPYIIPRDDLKCNWIGRLRQLGDGLKVGVSWRSGVQDYKRNKYYADYESLAPLFKMQGVHWINLNYSNVAGDVMTIKKMYGVDLCTWDDLDLKNDFESVSALTSCLDLVISAATCPAVIAKAVGVPTWMFMIGAAERGSEPTYDHELHYPAMVWLKSFDEDYREVFDRMVVRLHESGRAGLL